jgi:hypothetical protein
MQILALILAIIGLGLWVGAYLNGEQFLDSGQFSFVTTLLGGREEAAIICGLVGGTLFVLGTLGVFGLVTLR